MQHSRAAPKAVNLYLPAGADADLSLQTRWGGVLTYSYIKKTLCFNADLSGLQGHIKTAFSYIFSNCTGKLRLYIESSCKQARYQAYNCTKFISCAFIDAARALK